MPGGVTRVGAQEAPGLLVVAQQAAGALALAADGLVGHADGELAGPLHLPVVAEPTEGLVAEDLAEPVEAVRMVGVELNRLLPHHLAAVVRQSQLFVSCVLVKREAKGICRRVNVKSQCRFLLSDIKLAWSKAQASLF